ncbi:LmbU family transcriptional regulator [Amycolatopsis sp. A133]|uniref:LmbU family transcriptional regulator n=1 Tax=Amycolatopsis sp. A133 TaxID=3064472 RepID=UPI0027F4565F|nr:LmbU family transcriptional regulator [Amycolatopsis sp. A133]MDQ7807548.1 LmbU family transcriptional regulator [Amycolatopsis sp. A133]
MRTGSISSRPDGAAAPRATAETAGRPPEAGVQFHKSGLLFTAKHSLSTWEKVGSNLFSFADSSTWWIADWLVYGESTFHDRYREAVQRTSLSYQTLRNYTWVARRFPLSRRRQGLSFSHHLEVVALDRPEQDYWLRKAEEATWSRNKLRGQIRSSKLAQQGEITQAGTGSGTVMDSIEPAPADAALAGPAPEAPLLALQLSAEDLEMIKRAAGKESEPVEAWAAEMLRRAAAGS